MSLIKTLVESFAAGDDARFYSAAIQLAASEARLGHGKLAAEIRDAVDAAKSQRGTADARRPIHLAEPRDVLNELVPVSQPGVDLADLVLAPEVEALLDRVIRESRFRGRLENWCVGPRRHLLFHGPPGCGKAFAAAALAEGLRVPLMTIRVDAFLARLSGDTARHLRLIFAEMHQRKGVYLFDYVGAVPRDCENSHYIVEAERFTTELLQLISADVSGGLIVVSTDHLPSWNRAAFQRFDSIVAFDRPNPRQIETLLERRLEAFKFSRTEMCSLANKTHELSHADVVRACDDAIRAMVIDGRDRVTVDDVATALDEVHWP